MKAISWISPLLVGAVVWGAWMARPSSSAPAPTTARAAVDSSAFLQGGARGPAAADLERRPGGAWMLTLEIDAAGVRVLQSLAKPELHVRPTRDLAQRPFRWTWRSADGRALAEGGFDPGPIDLDPRHRGLGPLTTGDTIVPRVAHLNVKVPPPVDDGARLEFSRRVGEAWASFGSAPLAEVRPR